MSTADEETPEINAKHVRRHTYYSTFLSYIVIIYNKLVKIKQTEKITHNSKITSKKVVCTSFVVLLNNTSDARQYPAQCFVAQGGEVVTNWKRNDETVQRAKEVSVVKLNNKYQQHFQFTTSSTNETFIVVV